MNHQKFWQKYYPTSVVIYVSVRHVWTEQKSRFENLYFLFLCNREYMPVKSSYQFDRVAVMYLDRIVEIDESSKIF